MSKNSSALIVAAIVVSCLGFLGVRPGACNLALAEGQDEAILENKGYLIPVEQVQVSPRVSGQIIEVFFEEGARIEKGAVLARIDPTPFELDYRRAEAMLAAARARFEEVRAGEMAKKGQRNERLEVVKAEVAVAEADLAKTKWQLDGTQVRAPIGGTILSKIAEKGNVVNPLSFNLKGSLCEIADLTRMDVEVTVQERDFRKVFKGQKCKIQLDAFPGTIYKGEVSRLGPIADRAKGAIPVRVRMDMPKGDAQVRPELGALVAFLGKGAS